MPPYDITRAMRGPARFYQQGLRRSKTLFITSALALLAYCTKPKPEASAPQPPTPAVVAFTGPTGWVEGTVTVHGNLPALHPHPLDGALNKQCGDVAPDLSLQVGDGGVLESAVVSIDDAQPSPLSKEFAPALLDQKRCVYRPSVVATRSGQSIKVRNSDPVLHNVRGMHLKAPIFNVMMPLENLTIDKPLPATPGIVELQCDVHPWMHAWAVTFPHDLFAATDSTGHFKISNIPVGRHPLKLWHPRLGEKRVEVEISAGVGTRLDVGWEIADTATP